MDFFIKNGRRWTSFDGYLRDITETRESLTIRKYAVVTKVLSKKLKLHTEILGI